MPELPEVETIRMGLEKYLVGHTIQSVDIQLKRIFSGNPNILIGAQFTAIKRFGKGLVLELSNGYSLAIHIKLTGQIIYQGSDIPHTSVISSKMVGKLPNNWTHVIFYLDHDAKLYYNDIRQFGWIKIIKTNELKTLPFFKALGPEPWRDLTEKTFTTIVSSARTSIKPLLMDQKKIGGIGNIYANDSLFLAKISPKRISNTLSLQEIERLFHAIELVMKKGLHYGGASELTFVNALGEEGHYQEHFLIYGQQGKQCSICGTTIKKITLAGRGTYYCPVCQPVAEE